MKNFIQQYFILLIGLFCVSSFAGIYMGAGYDGTAMPVQQYTPQKTANPVYVPTYPTKVNMATTVAVPPAVIVPTTVVGPAPVVTTTAAAITPAPGQLPLLMPAPAAAPLPPAALVSPVTQCYQPVAGIVGPGYPAECPPAPIVLAVPERYEVRTGSLKANVEHLVAQSGWGRVVWNVPNDYHWIGDITITAPSIQDALNQYLDPYPVEAVFYKTNHVVDIVPRREA